MRVDQQQRVMRRRVRRRDGDAVRARRLDVHGRRPRRSALTRFARLLAVERLELAEIDALDVAADAALAEASAPSTARSA